jgi:hypothetical protein
VLLDFSDEIDCVWYVRNGCVQWYRIKHSASDNFLGAACALAVFLSMYSWCPVQEWVSIGIMDKEAIKLRREQDEWD